MRVFLAGTLPSSVLRQLQNVLAPLRNELPPASWMRPDAQHVTLQFVETAELGVAETDANQWVRRWREQLGASLPSARSFTAQLRGCGAFPAWKRPRVLWTAPRDQAPWLALHQASVKASGADPSERFTAHLTVARLRVPWPESAISRFRHAMDGWRSEPFPVNEVVLFESRLQRRGAVHERLDSFALDRPQD